MVALARKSLSEERWDCLEDKVSEHHPPTPDHILANKGQLDVSPCRQGFLISKH
jgi:hypothetical protein